MDGMMHFKMNEHVSSVKNDEGDKFIFDVKERWVTVKYVKLTCLTPRL
jgi:hypothetical protein